MAEAPFSYWFAAELGNFPDFGRPYSPLMLTMPDAAFADRISIEDPIFVVDWFVFFQLIWQ